MPAVTRLSAAARTCWFSGPRSRKRPSRWKATARGITLLQATLGKLVGPPLTEVQTLDQLRAEQGGMPSGSEAPPEEGTELVHAMLDQQYRATLDEPVGMLGDISPRAASRTAAGRECVVAWLKHLENRSASQRDPADPMATYDFAWMWRELGVANMRQ